MLWYRLTLETGSHCFCVSGCLRLCVCQSFSVLLQKTRRKRMMVVKRICYYRNQKFVSCLFLAPRSSNEAERHAHKSYLDALLLIFKMIQILSHILHFFYSCKIFILHSRSVEQTRGNISFAKNTFTIAHFFCVFCVLKLAHTVCAFL